MADITREDVVAHIAQQKPLRGFNLGGLDLSQLRLRDANFQSADLTGANLVAC